MAFFKKKKRSLNCEEGQGGSGPDAKGKRRLSLPSSWENLVGGKEGEDRAGHPRTRKKKPNSRGSDTQIGGMHLNVP